MAIGTPVAGAVAYSAANGTSVAPAYPAGITVNDGLLLIIGQKPSTANSGTVTTPTGWTLVDSLTAAGGYGTTLGADTGNTNLYIYKKDTVAGTETGTLTVTVGTNNVCWAYILLVPTTNGAPSYGSADGSRTTAPTAGTPFAVALTNGTTATNFQTSDLAVWAMCIPTDVGAGAQFSAPSVTATGATFSAGVELREPSSGTGNDIGGYSAYASVSSGSSTTAPTVTVTASGTVTNVRGPIVLVRVREPAAPASQTLTQSARFDNTNIFYSPTVTKRNTLTQTARLNNTNIFYAPTVTARNALFPPKYFNLNVFYSPTVTKGAANLAPARFNNTNTIYSATVTQGVYVLNQHTRLNNVNSFFAPTVGRGAVNLVPARYNNTNIFYSPYVTQGVYVLYQHTRFDNTNIFYPLDVEEGPYDLHQNQRLDNVSIFYSPTVTAVLPPAQNFDIRVEIRSFTERRRF